MTANEWKLEYAKRRLTAYYEAEQACLRGQSYRIGDRELRRADLSEIREAIADLENQIAELESMGRGRVKRVVFYE